MDRTLCHRQPYGSIMALTSTTTFDIVGGTQSIIFSNPSAVDQISFSSNQVTFAISSTYSLSKSDFALYYKYLSVFNLLLARNFPSIGLSVNTSWPSPGTSFSITQTNPPPRIVYNQASLGTTVINISYLPVASAATFATRSSPVTISTQEYLSFINVISEFSNQVALN